MTTYICTCGISIITKRNIDFEKIKGIPLTQWEKYGTDIELIKEKFYQNYKIFLCLKI